MFPSRAITLKASVDAILRNEMAGITSLLITSSKADIPVELNLLFFIV